MNRQETDKIPNKEIRFKERHITTIAGPQAEAMLSILDGNHSHSWKDKSVKGLPLIELWAEVTSYEERAGTY